MFLENYYEPIIEIFFRSSFTEEIVTKRKTELTTTKQIETRVKRHVKFEDGKVLEDSGPIISTASKKNLSRRCIHRVINEIIFFLLATEDTDKVESEQTEVERNLFYRFDECF